MNKVDWQKVFEFSAFDVVKIFLTALVIVVVTKVQLFNDKLSALLIALPLTSLLAMIWMQVEGQGKPRIANHAESTFWFVLPTLPMFLVLPWMLRHGWSFGAALVINCLMTAGLFWVLVWVGRKMGVNFY